MRLGAKGQRMKLGLKRKTYLLTVEYKGFWPFWIVIDYHYATLVAVLEHVAWLGEQVKGQNGEDGIRKNVVISFYFEEFLFSKARNKKQPPLDRFIASPGREKPLGGEERSFEFDE